MIIRPTLPETPNYTTPRGTIQKYDDLVRVIGIEATQNKSIEGGGTTAQNVVNRPTADLGSDSVPNRHTNKSRHHHIVLQVTKKYRKTTRSNF